MVELLAWGLEVGHPAAYLFIFVLFEPAVVFILFAIWDWIKDRKEHKK